jgi:hypothetical protein
VPMTIYLSVILSFRLYTSFQTLLPAGVHITAARTQNRNIFAHRTGECLGEYRNSSAWNLRKFSRIGKHWHILKKLG